MRRPSMNVPCSASLARSASSARTNVTKPKPCVREHHNQSVAVVHRNAGVRTRRAGEPRAHAGGRASGAEVRSAVRRQ